jgi:molybdenum cofactor cytidylyltransferase
MDIPDLISCIILSAGNSGRMGMHKALLPFGDENLTFLEKITQSYHQAGINQVIVVLNEALYNLLKTRKIALPGEVEIVVNPHPEKGRFFSLQTGLSKVMAGSHVFIQNADNPFTEPVLLADMIENRAKAGVIFPSYSGKAGHPVLINASVCESARMCLNPDIRLDYFLRDFPSFFVESDNCRILVNINTPSDYRREFEGSIYLR